MPVQVYSLAKGSCGYCSAFIDWQKEAEADSVLEHGQCRLSGIRSPGLCQIARGKGGGGLYLLPTHIMVSPPHRRFGFGPAGFPSVFI